MNMLYLLSLYFYLGAGISIPHVAEYIPTVLIARDITVFYERVEGFIPAA